MLKPFRTIEDIHVFLALLGWLTKLARRSGWAAEHLERTLVAITSFSTLADATDPLSPALHRALGGAIALVEDHIQRLELGPSGRDSTT